MKKIIWHIKYMLKYLVTSEGIDHISFLVVMIAAGAIGLAVVFAIVSLPIVFYCGVVLSVVLLIGLGLHTLGTDYVNWIYHNEFEEKGQIINADL